MPVFEKTTFSPSAHTRNAPTSSRLPYAKQPTLPPSHHLLFTPCPLIPLPHGSLMQSRETHKPAPYEKREKTTNQPPLCKARKTHKPAHCAKREKPINQPPLCKAGKTHKSAPLVQRGEVKGGLSPRLPLPVKIAPLSPPPLRAASPYHKGRHENGA